jgi:ParB family chromosome partitioning protein
MRSERKALGRGLSELLGTPEPETRQFRQIPIDRISPNAAQPRKSFDNSSLDELAASIREHGIVQPVVVRTRADGRFELIAGERRWRAAQKAGLRELPAVVRESGEHESLELALVENLQREDLNPIDEGKAYQRLASEFGLTQDQIAERVGKNRTTITNSLRLLKLPGEVQQWLLEGRLTSGHAKALLSLSGPDAVIEAAREIIRRQLSVRQAEALTRAPEPSRGTSGSPAEDPNVRAALMDLERALGTRVTIQQKRGKGRLELHFHSTAELERLYDGLLRVRFGGPQTTSESATAERDVPV